MTYRNNQYHRLNYVGRSGDTDSRHMHNMPADNPDFMYPDNKVRYVDSQGNPDVFIMKKGYIRNIPTSESGLSAPKNKCQFQFNPSNIVQSVTASSKYVDMLHQDPAQYSQPMPGNVNMSFNLRFDRSHELNNYDPNSARADSLNPWNTGDPSEVGVYRDIAALYQVIGQGTYSDNLEYLKAVGQRRLVLEYNQSEDVSQWENLADMALSVLEEQKIQGAFDSSEEFLNLNIGNTGFLLPIPVRIVFSGLYIVEGFVQSTSVTYSKWTPTLVPMMAEVSIQVDSKYVGFAQENAFLTASLRNAAELQEKEAQQAVEEMKQARDLLSTHFNTIKVGLDRLDGSGRLTSNAAEVIRNYQSATTVVQDETIHALPEVTSDAISNAISEDTIPNIRTSVFFDLFGPYTESSLSGGDPDDFGEAGWGSQYNLRRTIAIAENEFGDVTNPLRSARGTFNVTTEDVFKIWNERDVFKVERDVYDAPSGLRVGNSQPLFTDDFETSNYYFIARWKVNFTVGSGSIPITGAAAGWQLLTGDQATSGVLSLPISWGLDEEALDSSVNSNNPLLDIPIPPSPTGTPDDAPVSTIDLGNINTTFNGNNVAAPI